jgi:hypothetical protein
MKVQKRKSREVTKARDILIVLDYEAGMKIKDLKVKHHLKSHQTIYDALDRYEKYTEGVSNLHNLVSSIKEEKNAKSR